MFVEPMLLCTNSLNGHATQKARVLTNFTCTQDFRSSEPYNQLALSSQNVIFILQTYAYGFLNPKA
jgi:hypothetical protein